MKMYELQARVFQALIIQYTRWPRLCNEPGRVIGRPIYIKNNIKYKSCVKNYLTVGWTQDQFQCQNLSYAFIRQYYIYRISAVLCYLNPWNISYEKDKILYNTNLWLIKYWASPVWLVILINTVTTLKVIEFWGNSNYINTILWKARAVWVA